MKRILVTIIIIAFFGTLALAAFAPKRATAGDITWGELKCMYHPECKKKPPQIPDDNKNSG